MAGGSEKTASPPSEESEMGKLGPESAKDTEETELDNALHLKDELEEVEPESNGGDDPGNFVPNSGPDVDLGDTKGVAGPEEAMNEHEKMLLNPRDAPEHHLDWHDNHPHKAHWTAKKLPHRSTEAHALARAEAASWAQMTPLLAATFGPLAVLLGIPSLTQHWSGTLLNPPVLPTGESNYVALPDPSLNLALEIVVVVCEFLGNILLVMRFSNYHTKTTTWGSYIFWWLKIIFGLTNLIQFGVTHPQSTTVIYLQGYWCGVCSIAVTVIIIIALTFNLAFLHSQSEIEIRRLHHVQQEFMIQTTSFFIYTGICALIFSQVEQLTYLTGIYYLVVITLTIGFGDVVPQTAVMKVFTFPFAICGITLLAIIVTSLVRLLSDRARRSKLLVKKRLKGKIKETKQRWRRLAPFLRNPGHKESTEEKTQRKLSLQEELHKLRQEDWEREKRANIRSMISGVTVFFFFWFIGALIFHYVEPWGYGNALYFCYIFFLTIGFGDFYPTTEAGKPIFIVYALLAVPTMTIIVQTVTTAFTSYMAQRLRSQKHQVYKDKDFEIQSLNSLVRVYKEKQSGKVDDEKDDDDDDESVHLPLHRTTERLLHSLSVMHHQLQNLMMQTLGSDARNVITAERARQMRIMKQLKKRKAEDEVDESEDKKPEEYIAPHLSEVGAEHGDDELQLLNQYRERYAAIIAELMISKERLLELEKRLRRHTTDEGLKKKIDSEIEDLSEDDLEVDGLGRKDSCDD